MAEFTRSTPPVRRALVIGDGGWGTALAMLLVRRGVETTLWSNSPGLSRKSGFAGRP